MQLHPFMVVRTLHVEMVVLQLTTIIACFAGAGAVASPSIHEVVDHDTDALDATAVERLGQQAAQHQTAFEDIAALLEEAPTARFLKTDQEKAERRANISKAVEEATGKRIAPLDTRNNSDDVESGVDDNLDQTENCETGQGTWMGPTVHTKKQKKAVKGWKDLPPIAPSKIGAKLGFVMMIYHTIVFKKSWQKLLEEPKVPFALLIHSKMKADLPKFFTKFLYNKKLPNDRCKNSKMMLMLMVHLMNKDKDVSHLAVVSGDSLPIKPLSHMTLDIHRDGCSRFCADTEWKRAETYYVMRRDHAQFLNKNMKQLFALIPTVDSNPKTDCLDEDMFYWPLHLRKESVCNSCPMMTDWTGTNKYWKINAKRCKCPAFLKSSKIQGSCARPSMFKDITPQGLDQLLSSPAGYWFARKFQGDGLKGKATYNHQETALDPAVESVLARMRTMPVMPLAFTAINVD